MTGSIYILSFLATLLHKDADVMKMAGYFDKIALGLMMMGIEPQASSFKNKSTYHLIKLLRLAYNDDDKPSTN